MVVAVNLDYKHIKSFYDHHHRISKSGSTVYDFNPSSSSFIQDMAIKANLALLMPSYIDYINNFYISNKLKNYCLITKMDKEYIGNVVLGVNTVDSSSLKEHIKPQSGSLYYGLHKAGYISIKKINIDKSHKPSEYYPAIVEAINKDGFDEFVMTISKNNKSLNYIFSTITKFCGGKIVKAKNVINYIINAYAEKVKQAFRDMELNPVKENEIPDDVFNMNQEMSVYPSISKNLDHLGAR